MNCTRITQTECSFLKSVKERRWTVVLRVRAEMGPRTSAWKKKEQGRIQQGEIYTENYVTFLGALWVFSLYSVQWKHEKLRKSLSLDDALG